MDDLDELLRDADPAAPWDSVVVDAHVRSAQQVARTMKPRRARGWRRARVLVPAVVGAAIVLTGAVIAVPLQLSLDNHKVPIDLHLPIHYTTASGQEISCTAGLYFSSPAGRTPAIVAALPKIKEHDWSHIGEDIYRYALAHPADAPQRQREKISFELAISPVVMKQLSGILPDDAGFTLTDDCSGQLS